MNVTKIGSFEAIALLLIVSINHLLLNMPQTIIDTCGSASLLNTVYTTILAFIIAYLILFLLFKKFPSCDILDVSNYLGGKVLKNIIGILCGIYMLTLSSVFLRNFAEGLKLIYFFDAPIKIRSVSNTCFQRDAALCAPPLCVCLLFCTAPFPCFALIKATSFLWGNVAWRRAQHKAAAHLSKNEYKN